MENLFSEVGFNPLLMEQVLEAFPGDVMVVDRNYAIVYTNMKRRSDLMGTQNLVGEKCYRYCRYLQKGSTDCYAKKVFTTGEPIKGVHHQLKDGKWLEINGIPLRNEMDELVMVAEFVSDVTEYKKPDSRAAAGQGYPGEDRRVLSLSSKKDGTWKWNPRTNHMSFSEELLDMLGYQPGDVMETFAKYTQMMHPKDFGQVLHDLEELKKQKTDVMTKEIRMQCADGRYKWICCQARSLVDRDGHLVEIQGIHKDISERKEREEQMQYQKMRDELTALYNRSYFEDTLRRLNTERMHPLTIFFVEVGNLKETYEAQGAEAAEAVLLKTAELMRSIFRYEDVVARWNDRTFAIVLPNTAAEMTETIYERITKTTEVYQEELKDAPLAIGYSTKNFVENDMEAVFMGARQRLNLSREALSEIH